MEEWKDVIGYEGYYQVSNKGRVRSLDRYIKRSDGVTQFKKGIVMTPKNSSDGYETVTLSKNGKSKSVRVHRLVAIHFLTNDNNYSEVNHKDFNRKNNAVDNLEWTTHKNNITYSKENGRYRIRNYYGSNNPNYGNRKLSYVYKNNPGLAKEKLARPENQNGMAKKIELYDKNMTYVATFDWIGGCANYLIENGYSNSSVKNIRTSITVAEKENRKYLGFYYKKV